MDNLTTFEDTQKTENRKITVVPRYGLQQGVIYVEPVYDERSGEFKGIPHNWEELRKAGKNTATPDDSFKFNFPSGQQYVFDLSNVQVAQRWAWIKHHPVIAESKEAAAQSPMVLAYVEDADEEMIKTSTIKRDKFLLEEWVRSLPAPTQVEICRLLGQRTSYMKPIDIEDYLVEKARSAKYLELKSVKEDKHRKSKLFLLELEDKKIIFKIHGGYKYGETILGLDIPSCIHWLDQSENREIVMQWRRQLNMGFEGESFKLETVLQQDSVEETKRSAGRPPKVLDNSPTSNA